MSPDIKSVLVFGAGFAGGWAARSLADSPQGAGVKLLEIALNAKERVGRWAAVEAERLEDMMAEVRARAELEASKAEAEPEPAEPEPKPKTKTNGTSHKTRPVSGAA